MSPQTPEEKKKALKWVIQQAKTIAVAALSTITVVGSGMWYVIENYLDNHIDTRVNEILEARGEKQSFREILGEQIGIPADVVPYHVAEKMIEIDSMVNHVQSFEDKYLPMIKKQEGIIPLYRYIDVETGQHYLFMPDGRPHPIMVDDYHLEWIIYGNQRVNVKDIRYL